MTGNTGKNAASIVKGLLSAVALTIAGMAALALLVVYAQLSDGALTALNQILKLAAIFAGAWIAVGPGGEKGLAKGAVIGLVYIALGYGICALPDGAAADGAMLALEFAMGLLLGGVSGALIANLPARGARRRKSRAA